MAYGILKVDNITFDNGGSDQNVTVSGLYRATTSGVTLSGTIAATTVSGVTVIGSTTVSGATVTGTTANFTSGNFSNIISSAATMSGALIMANQQQVRFREAVGNGVNHIALQAPAIVSADQTITLPDQTGTVVTTGDNGSVTSTMILDGTILNVDINASAGIVDTKLATIATAGKVSNSATTATNANTASAIVARDASGNFTAGTITAALTGAASSNVLKAGDTMTGALVVPLASAATPSLTFTSDLNTGIYSPGADQLAISTNGTGRVNFGTGEVVFNDDGNNYDLRIEGDTNADLFFVDASTDRIGIGTAVPSEPLAVRGNVFIESTSTTANSGNGLFWQSTANGSHNSANAHAAIYGVRTDVGNGYLRFDTRGSSTTQERLRITSDGKVGLGTSSPGARLQVNAPSSGRSYSSSVLDFSNIHLDGITANTTTSALTFSSGGGGGAAIAFSRGGSFQTEMSFWTCSTATADSATERLRIDSSGRVGIGTSSPSEKLHVSGIIIGDANDNYFGSYSSGSAYLDIGNLATSAAWIDARSTSLADVPLNIRSKGTGEIAFHGGFGEKVRIDSSGNVGIGTSSPGAKLHVVGSAGTNFGVSDGSAYGLRIDNGIAYGLTGSTIHGVDQTFFGSYQPLVLNGSQLGFAIGGTERLRIDSSGNVGIGTSSPSTLLDVNANTVRVRTARTPASATATGATGEICWDANYIYVCTATNTWRRTAISSW